MSWLAIPKPFEQPYPYEYYQTVHRPRWIRRVFMADAEYQGILYVVSRDLIVFESGERYGNCTDYYYMLDSIARQLERDWEGKQGVYSARLYIPPLGADYIRYGGTRIRIIDRLGDL